MKTILLFFLILSASILNANNMQAQVNLAQNGSFEIWTNSAAAPDGWTYNIPNDPTLAVYSQIIGTPETGEVTEGTKALSIVSTTNAAVRISQIITSGIESGKSYTLSLKYKVTELPNRENATDGIKLNWTWYDVADNWLDGGGSSATAYPSVLDVWMEATENISSPANASKAQIEISVNRQADVVYDDLQVIKSGDDTSIRETICSLPLHRQFDKLIVNSEVGSNIEVYNALGVKLQSKTAVSEETEISGLPQGQLLIVRSGKATGKIIL